MLFKTNTEKEYYYDDGLGVVSPKEIGIQKKCIEREYNQNVNQTMLEEHLKKNGSTQLTLILDEMCNMRCKYCIYSGEYDHMRNHQYKAMSSETAKRAIDNYLSDFQAAQKYNHSALPVIGFYGGEPLLNFELLEECVNYISENYSSLGVVYTVTSNITLLSKRKLEFLIKNNINLCISLNGDRNENDRLRVFIGGEGSYDIIQRKIELIKTVDEKYLEKCSYSCTFDIGSDLILLNEFFGSKQSNGIKLIRASAVSPYFSDWYSQYKDAEVERYREQYEELRKVVVSKIINAKKLTELETALFIPQYIQILNRLKGISIEKSSPIYKYRMGSCVPGDKRAVNPEGQYLMCERVNYSRDIGDIENGLDVAKIEDLINEFNEKSKKCQGCNISRLCNMCYANILNEKGEIESPMENQCIKQRNNIKDLLSDIYSMLEVNNNIYYTCGLLKEGERYE